MSVSLQKGQKVSLSKESQGLTQVIVAIGWDEAKRKGGLFSRISQSIDCDAAAILLKNGKLCKKEDIVYYGNLQHNSNAVKHMGDNLTGAGEGDDEQIVLDLLHIPQEYNEIVIVINIYKAVQRKQDFGMIKNAFVRIIDARGNRELCKYDLSENYDGMTAMIFGKLYRNNGEWMFDAIGQATKDLSLGELANRFVTNRFM